MFNDEADCDRLVEGLKEFMICLTLRDGYQYAKYFRTL